MNEITQSQTPMSGIGSVAIVIGTAIAAGQAFWPADEAPTYIIDQIRPSYSEVSEQVLAATKSPHSSFVNQIASIYASFSQRQQLLGGEFEAAIFENLDSLYES